MAKATFYNGILAIFAGVMSNIAAEWAQLGPLSPFMIAVPCLLISALLTMYMWEENDIKSTCALNHGCASLEVIFRTRTNSLLWLGIVQSLFESVMYTFVFIWTPTLEPLKPPLGIVFSCFMLCIMIGSSIYSFLLARNCLAQHLLHMSFVLALFALILSAGAMKMVSLYPQDTVKYTLVAFIAFLIYEVAVGMYFPAVGYLRSQIIPEQYRASIANWYRVPMNIFTCLSLFWFKNNGHNDKEFAFDTAVSSLKAFLMCIILLFIAIVFCNMLKKGNDNIKLIMESV